MGGATPKKHTPLTPSQTPPSVAPSQSPQMQSNYGVLNETRLASCWSVLACSSTLCVSRVSRPSRQTQSRAGWSGIPVVLFITSQPQPLLRFSSSLFSLYRPSLRQSSPPTNKHPTSNWSLLLETRPIHTFFSFNPLYSRETWPLH